MGSNFNVNCTNSLYSESFVIIVIYTSEELVFVGVANMLGGPFCEVDKLLLRM